LAVVAPVLIRSISVRGLVAACLLGLWIFAAAPAVAADSTAADSTLEIQVLKSAAPPPTVSAVVDGSLDAQFGPITGGSIAGAKVHKPAGGWWLKLEAVGQFNAAGIPVVVMHASRQIHAELYAARAGRVVSLPRAAELPAFRGTADTVFAIVEGLDPGRPLYAHLDADGADAEPVRFSSSRLDLTLARGADQSRMIALAFGALMAVALAALLIWFVQSDRLFILYATLFFLQALYVVYLSGQGFDWPWLSVLRPFGSFTWNVPIGLSGAIACLFTREIADLEASEPRIYTAFGWFAAAFVVVTVLNLAKLLGLGVWVNGAGNLVFAAAATFTLTVTFRAWRRGNRAAGWLLIAWGLLEGFTIAAAMRFLAPSSEASPLLYYYGLPLSMVAAAVLIALGVADRLRAQRVALTDAERRAQTDPLTGVLNRRSLIERLDAASARARARGLPIAVLFIDLDHFKQINDSFGHQAGDACLRAIIPPIHAELRQSDAVGRYGGEEFVVILSSADAVAAMPIAQRILERIAGLTVPGYGKPIRLTCSIGVAASDTSSVWGENLIAQADAAVYVAKRLGRNQVQVAAPLAA